MNRGGLQIKRALIVRKPYADLIVTGAKPWELRSRKVNIRGRIGIIQAGSGLIIGEVDLIGWHEYSYLNLVNAKMMHLVDDHKMLRKWPIAWVLENPLKYETPVKYVHPPGAQSWVKLGGRV